ncbi:MAG: thioredoxin family protein [Clostridia bacterium]|nr:thioredoxin family protein [Clostridia bacterium]
MNQSLTIFYMEGCPYCRNAKKAVQELQKADPRYASIPLTWIDENKEPELASAHDYYYVPTIYLGNRKLYEASPSQGYTEIRNEIENAFLAFLSEKTAG